MPWTSRKAKSPAPLCSISGWKAWMVRKLHFLMQLSSTHARYFFSELTGTSFMILQQNREKEEVCILVTASFSLPLFCTKLESRGRSGPSMSQVFEIAAQMKKKTTPTFLILTERCQVQPFSSLNWFVWPSPYADDALNVVESWDDHTKIWGVRLQTANSLRLARCVTHTTPFPSRNISRFGGVGTAACRWKPLCLPVINRMFVKEVNPKYFWNVALLFHCLKRQRRPDLCCISTALNQDALCCGDNALKSFRRESAANMAPPTPAPFHQRRLSANRVVSTGDDRWQVRYRTSLS